MIKKFLQIAGNEVFLLGQKKEMPGREIVAIEVDLPPDVFWKMQEILKEALYTQTNAQDALKAADLYKKVMKQAMPYAIAEKDRIWLQEKLGIT